MHTIAQLPVGSDSAATNAVGISLTHAGAGYGVRVRGRRGCRVIIGHTPRWNITFYIFNSNILFLGFFS
jgi:hypothetical protein